MILTASWRPLISSLIQVMNSTNLKTKYSIIVIILAAVILRLTNLSYMEFKGDEARLSTLAFEMIDEGYLPLKGNMSSIGTYNSPLFVYLLGIPFFFSTNPIFAAGFIAVLNVLAVYFCFLFCCTFFNNRVGIIASSFFAVNPWAVLYARKIWNGIIIPFVMIFFYLLFAAIIKRRGKYMCACFGVLSVLIQLHPQAIYLGGILLLSIVIYKPGFSLKIYLTGIAIGILLAVPYLIFEIQNNFYNFKKLISILNYTPVFQMEAFYYPYKLATTLGFFPSASAPPIVLTVLSLLIIGLITASILLLIPNWIKPENGLLLFWMIFPILMMVFGKVTLHQHYFIFLYPVQFILIGIILDKILLHRKTSVLNGLVGLITFLLIAGPGMSAYEFFKNQIRRQPIISWLQYGPTYSYRLNEIKSSMAQGETDPRKIHKAVLHNKSFEAAQKYDYIATEYIVRMLKKDQKAI